MYADGKDPDVFVQRLCWCTSCSEWWIKKGNVIFYRWSSLPIQARTTLLSLRHDMTDRERHTSVTFYYPEANSYRITSCQWYNDITHVLLWALNLLSLLLDRGLRRQLPPGNRKNIYTLHKSILTFKQVGGNVCLFGQSPCLLWPHWYQESPGKQVLSITSVSPWVHLVFSDLILEKLYFRDQIKNIINYISQLEKGWQIKGKTLIKEQRNITAMALLGNICCSGLGPFVPLEGRVMANQYKVVLSYHL